MRYLLCLSVLFLFSCDLFEPRSPADPSGGGVVWQTPTSPDIVVENMQSALNGLSAQYLDCLHDSFMFYADNNDIDDYPTLDFTDWNKGIENLTIGQIYGAVPEDSLISADFSFIASSPDPPAPRQRHHLQTVHHSDSRGAAQPGLRHSRTAHDRGRERFLVGGGLVRQQVQPVHTVQDLGGCKGGVPLRTVSGREVTSDTLLLARLASSIPFKVCIDLGTGTGGVLRCMDHSGKGLAVGIDKSPEALARFDRRFGEPVLCPVETAVRAFRRGCADLVLANPPYFVSGRGRPSPNRLRAQARQGTPMTVHRFIFAGAHLLRPRGTMVITCRRQSLEGLRQGLRAAGFLPAREVPGEGVLALVALLGNLRARKMAAA